MVEINLIAGYIQSIFVGLLIGGVYGLSALGLSLIWGVMKVINAAHGHLIMLGAFLSYQLFVSFGINPLQSLFIVPLLGALLGILTYKGIVRRILMQREMPHELMSLIVMFGFAAIVYGLAAYIWGIDIRGIPFYLGSLSLGFLIVPMSKLITFVVATILTVSLYLLLRKTFMGKAIRALAQNRDAVMVTGVNPDTIYAIVFSISFLYAFIAGVMVSIVQAGLNPYLGVEFVGRAFAIVVLGGLGNPIGALVGGLVLGIAEGIAVHYVTYGFVPAISFIILILILLFKPTGLFSPLR